MKVSGSFKFCGAEIGTTKAGKEYYLIGLLQGLDSSRIYVDLDMYNQCKGIAPFADVECNLSINISDRGTFVNCDSIVPANAGKGGK